LISHSGVILNRAVRVSISPALKKIQNRRNLVNIIMHKKKYLQALIIVVSVLLFGVVFLGSFAELVYDMEFYEKEYEKNDVYESLGDDVGPMTEGLFGYLKGKNELSEQYFNEKERLHLVDVKNLIDLAFINVIILIFFYIMC